MLRWILPFGMALLIGACQSTSSSASSGSGENGGEKIEEAYHLKVTFLSYDAGKKLYELKVEDIMSIPQAPVEVLTAGDVVHARNTDEDNELRDKVLTQATNQPFDIWLTGRPSMQGTDWIINKYKID